MSPSVDVLRTTRVGDIAMAVSGGGSGDRSWIDLEFEDDLDEEREQEVDDRRFPPELRELLSRRRVVSIDRQHYFSELLRLQSELIKLQDWVAHTGLKVVVLFEGRDSAGKGGVIKRITQRINPRTCRVVALPAVVSPHVV
jgi:polyphosphate kinase